MAAKVHLPAAVSRIVLIGFMGAGKSTVGALLAPLLGWQFLDADAVLEERTGSTIAEIFARHGEAVFRQMETEVIRELLQERRLVLALGGGAVETPSTREAIFSSPETCVVFLEAPLETMISRCEQQPNAAVRPVLKEREQLRSRFESRLPHYRNAHLVVETTARTPDETAQRIIDSLGLLLKEGQSA
jgi:shikimate kinase